MAKTNLQIRIPMELETQIERLAPKSKSEFVRRAIEEKVRCENDRRLEEQWIKILAEQTENKAEAEAWLKAERWESS